MPVRERLMHMRLGTICVPSLGQHMLPLPLGKPQHSGQTMLSTSGPSLPDFDLGQILALAASCLPTKSSFIEIERLQTGVL